MQIFLFRGREKGYYHSLVHWPAIFSPSSPAAAPSMTVPFAGSATRAAATRSCCRPVSARGRWGPFTAAAWSTGSPPPTPATVSSATSGLQWSASPGHWWRSVRGAHPWNFSFTGKSCACFCAGVTEPLRLHWGFGVLAIWGQEITKLLILEQIKNKLLEWGHWVCFTANLIGGLGNSVQQIPGMPASLVEGGREVSISVPVECGASAWTQHIKYRSEFPFSSCFWEVKNLEAFRNPIYMSSSQEGIAVVQGLACLDICEWPFGFFLPMCQTWQWIAQLFLPYQ